MSYAISVIIFAGHLPSTKLEVDNLSLFEWEYLHFSDHLSYYDKQNDFSASPPL